MVTSLPLTEVGPGCCAPVTVAPLSEEAAAELARVLKAVADPTRLRLLSLLSAAEQGELCVCELTAPLGLAQPTISHHLKVLHDVGLVHRETRGVWRYYRVVPSALAGVASIFSAGTMAAV
jgi:ArsR family transcriptional regulator